MNLFQRHAKRGRSACAATVVFLASVSAIASARTNTFNVSTTISTACSVTNGGPSDLVAAYSPVIDAGSGESMTLSTLCTGSTPTISFSDAVGSGSAFRMTGPGGASLWYYLSNGTSCSGSPADNPMSQGAPQVISPGSSAFDICAAVISGSGLNAGAVPGIYTDEVTYTISP